MPERRNPTADKLRDRIDRGRGGDKVNFSDPAAAPLGTDDEAAGTPPTQEQLDRAWRAEIASDRRAANAEPEEDSRTPAEVQPGGAGAKLAIAFVVIVVLAGVVLAALT